MIKIVSDREHQRRRFVCPRCGTIFEADFSDTVRISDGNVVECPRCYKELSWVKGELTDDRD